ncbi:DUF167 domain-containing protein [Marivibrio halodurans]|uniref:UPF0235 protein KAJ83_04895 n=1 Tax=Marivibrio halodurans TaxID=2039722 RepID=A0A8J7S0B0_9PROT|nr:DUF167 domain-containing protein [Marivibrio halodurans]MBP5856334.1 DUF167 domain-containing protein [Marivibrio halodurans]
MAGTPADPFRRETGALLIALKVTPKASAERVGGLVDAADETGTVGRRLVLHVTAPPSDGAANKAVVKLLAKALSLPKTSLAIVSGATGRNKVVRIATDDPADLEAGIRARLEQGG